MTDRIKQEEYQKAKRFAEKVDRNYLEKGISALPQLPYFSGLMVESGLNPNSQEHCELVRQSLEERLKGAGNEMIVRPSDALSVLSDPLFGELYKVKENLLRISEKYFPLNKLGLAPIHFEPILSERYSTIVDIGNNYLDFRSFDNNECCRAMPLRLGAARIKYTYFRNKLKAYGTYTKTIRVERDVFWGPDFKPSRGRFRNFDREAEIALMIPSESQLRDRFVDYINNVFLKIPSVIEEELEKLIIKRKRASDEIISRLGTGSMRGPVEF